MRVVVRLAKSVNSLKSFVLLGSFFCGPLINLATATEEVGSLFDETGAVAQSALPFTFSNFKKHTTPVDISASNAMLFSVVRVFPIMLDSQTISSDGAESSGTGCLYGVYKERTVVPTSDSDDDFPSLPNTIADISRIFLVTNKHVAGLSYNDGASMVPAKRWNGVKLRMQCVSEETTHKADGIHETLTQCELRNKSDGTIDVIINNPRWISHHNDHVDLCALEISDFVKDSQNKTNPIVVRMLNTKFADKATVADLSPSIQRNIGVGVDVFMLGYPSGWGGDCDMPLLRRGTISSDPRIGQSSSFLVDINCTPGSSGSPVLFRQTTFQARVTDTSVAHSSRLQDDEVEVTPVTKYFLLGFLAFEKTSKVRVGSNPTTEKEDFYHSLSKVLLPFGCWYPSPPTGQSTEDIRLKTELKQKREQAYQAFQDIISQQRLYVSMPRDLGIVFKESNLRELISSLEE